MEFDGRVKVDERVIANEVRKNLLRREVRMACRFDQEG